MNDQTSKPKVVRGKHVGVMESTIRVTGRVTPDINEELKYWAVELGMQKTAFISLCIRAGLKAVIRSVSPEDAISSDKLAEVLRAVEAQKAYEATFTGVLEDGFPP